MDPASLLVKSHFREGLPEIPHEWLAMEYVGDDYNKMADVARSASGLATLHEAPAGDPNRSPRYHHATMPYEGDQELIAALRAARRGRKGWTPTTRGVSVAGQAKP
ncbi:hypothetical protein BH23ACT4_BH23ACT4_10570 [soil metagenome]